MGFKEYLKEMNEANTTLDQFIKEMSTDEEVVKTLEDHLKSKFDVQTKELKEQAKSKVKRISINLDRIDKIKEQNNMFIKVPKSRVCVFYSSAKKKIGEANAKAQRGTGNSQYGTCWISNTLIKKTIKIKKEFLFDYISEGWIKKRILKW